MLRNVTDFDTEYDVVIVGSGASGKMAALTAHKEGLRPVILEKMPETGGTSVYAEGMCAFESSVQKAAAPPAGKNFPTKMEGYDTYNAYSHYRCDFNVVRRFVDESAETIDILKDYGVNYYFVGWGSGAPHELGTFHLPEGLGAAVQEQLRIAVEKAGIDVFTSTPVKELIMNDDKVCGVVAEDLKTGDKMTVGGKAVILATGGICNNPEYVAKYTWFQNSAYNMSPLAPLQNVGDGLDMALSAGMDSRMIVSCGFPGIGARNKMMDSPISATAVQPLVWVDKNGSRFTKEDISVGDAGVVWAKQIDGAIYTILDADQLQHLIEVGSEIQLGEFVKYHKPMATLRAELTQTIADGLAWTSDSIEGLARQAGIDSQALKSTIDEYNGFCASGKDIKFFKSAEYLKPVVKAPFYMIEAAPNCMLFTGGIKVNENMQVVNERYHAIPGLYAIGNDSAGCLMGDTYNLWVGGSCNGFAHTSGRIASKHIAQELKNNL